MTPHEGDFANKHEVLTTLMKYEKALADFLVPVDVDEFIVTPGHRVVPINRCVVCRLSVTTNGIACFRHPIGTTLLPTHP